MSKNITVALLGFGTVGKGVLRILQDHADKISSIIGKKITISIVLVRNIEKYKAMKELKHIEITNNIDDIINSDVDIVVEVMGSIDDAYHYIMRALQAKKHVVTANKDLIAQYGSELMTIAYTHQCDLYYEASVGGGIPILRTLVNSMASDRIEEIVGIVNGTTNFMLTQMSQYHLSYQEALKQAQQLGYAESNPTNDVKGFDAARKMVILSRLAFGMNIDLDDIKIEGITNIDKKDIKNAKALNYKIKLLGLAKLVNQKLYVEVGPVLVNSTHPLSSVENENNAIFVVGAAVGQTMYYGAGAGELPTANSVVSDMINISKNIKLQTNGNVFSAFSKHKNLLSKENMLFSYYYRVEMADKPGIFLELTKIFAQYKASFKQINQTSLKNGNASVMVISHPMSVSCHETISHILKEHDTLVLHSTMRVM